MSLYSVNGLFAYPVYFLEDAVEALAQIVVLEMSPVLRVCVFLALVIVEINAFVVYQIFCSVVANFCIATISLE